MGWKARGLDGRKFQRVDEQAGPGDAGWSIEKGEG